MTSHSCMVSLKSQNQRKVITMVTRPNARKVATYTPNAFELSLLSSLDMDTIATAKTDNAAAVIKLLAKIPQY